MFQNLPRIKKVLELRRSNAAQPIPSKKIYKRKQKHKRRVDLTEQIAPAKAVRAKTPLRQVTTHPEICEVYHKINIRHADSKMVNVGDLGYNCAINKRKENNAKHR